MTVLPSLIAAWKADPDGSYRSWFLWEERLKNFRSIRRGIQTTIDEIRAGSFGNAYRGSSLETVVSSIAEQRQIFRGADHAFLWKPKLRIPDIYEDPANQRAFGQLLDTCLCCNTEAQVLAAIHRIDALRIKGLGPAVANLLYFLHPTIVPPFNTAIVKGYNALTGARTKLGRWDEYLALRQGLMALNARHAPHLSNDLGAVAALMFDIGSGRYALPAADGEASRAAWEADLERVRAEASGLRKADLAAHENDHTHTEVQAWLRDLGLALKFDVWIAANDQGRAWNGGRLADGCLADLPAGIGARPGAASVRLIDILWFERGSGAAVAAFEVEHSTSIYSGILRMLDLAVETRTPGGFGGCFLVAPDAREADVRQQLRRPAFRRVEGLDMRFIPYGELRANRAAIARFGSGMDAIHALSRALA